MIQIKINRNDKCHCGSNKKYKLCCLLFDIKSKSSNFLLDKLENNKTEDVILNNLIETLQKNFVDYKIINLTEEINDEESYIKFQKENMYLLEKMKKKILMICKKNDKNKKLFEKRLNDYSGDKNEMDIMILYNGTYRFINSENIFQYINGLHMFYK